MRIAQNFKVVAVSQNTNSFGLRQMVMVSRDGTTCTGCFNSLNVKQKGESISGQVNILHDKIISVSFPGGELVKLGDEKAPKAVLKQIF